MRERRRSVSGTTIINGGLYRRQKGKKEVVERRGCGEERETNESQIETNGDLYASRRIP